MTLLMDCRRGGTCTTDDSAGEGTSYVERFRQQTHAPSTWLEAVYYSAEAIRCACKGSSIVRAIRVDWCSEAVYCSAEAIRCACKGSSNDCAISIDWWLKAVCYYAEAIRCSKVLEKLDNAVHV